MVTLTHPTIQGVSQDVPEAHVKRWVKSGWVAPATVPNSTKDSGSTHKTAPQVAAKEKE